MKMRNKNNEKLFSLSLANSISDKKNDNLPSKTKLNEKRQILLENFLFLQIKYLILIIVFLMTII